MDKSKVRVRATNFTPAEAVNLLKIIEDHKEIIENKKTDQTCVKDKLRAWELVARQYNATTCGGSRTVNNLQNAYKNLKKKTKKAYSSEKMTMPLKKEDLVLVVEEVGEDWPAVSQVVGAPENQCEQEFAHLKEEAKKQLSSEKKAVMGTGGGPPETDEDIVMEKVKGLIGPALDGSYSQYDGDRLLAGPEPYIDELILPAEAAEEIIEPFFESKRGNLKRKKNILLKSNNKPNKNISVSEKFKDLADYKSELVKKQLATEEIKFKDAQAQFEHNELIRALALEEAKLKMERSKQLHAKEMGKM